MIVNVICNQIRLLSALFEPYMPSLSAKINFLLGLKERSLKDETILETINTMKTVESLLEFIPKDHTIN